MNFTQEGPGCWWHVTEKALRGGGGNGMGMALWAWSIPHQPCLEGHCDGHVFFFFRQLLIFLI